MSDQSLHDTATDLVVDPWSADSPPFAWSRGVGWAGATALTAGGVWFGIFTCFQLLVGPAPLDGQLFGGLAATAAACATVGGLYGFIGGAVAGMVRRRSARLRSAYTWGSAFAVAAAVGGGAFPLVVAATAGRIPSAIASGLAWATIGAAVGGIGYVRSHSPGGRLMNAANDDGETWTLAGAGGWGVAVGALAVGIWLGLLTVLRLLPDPVRLGPLLRGNEAALAALFAGLAGCIGLVIGCISGFLFGAPTRLASGFVRGLGFAAVAAIGGGLFPLAVVATSGWISPDLSSSLTMGAVTGCAAVVVYTWTRRKLATHSAGLELEDWGDRQPAPIELRLPGSAGAESSEPGVLSSPPGGWSEATLEDPVQVLTSNWDPEPSVANRAAPPPGVTTNRAQSTGAFVRVAPVLMVSVACLLAVGLSAPSPVGWAMLAVGFLGLAAAWAVLGQERRIRELERRLAANERPAADSSHQ